MGRITKQIVDYLKQQKQNKVITTLIKNKKEVNINGYGTHKYTIKQGVNKGKVL